MNAEDPAEIERDVDAIADRYLDQLNAGEAPSRDALLAAHPRIADRLARRLAMLERIHRAARPSSTASSWARSAPLRCPHCGHPQKIPPAVSPELICSNCGSSFRVEAKMPAGRLIQEAPERIGKFKILSILGRGAFGAVYKARDEELSRLVALKIPRAGYFCSGEEEERFLREARSAALLRHPGIVQVFEISKLQEIPYIANEFIEGSSLAERIAGSRPSFREAAEIVAHAAGALDYAHHQGIVHRDIKPANILMDLDGRPHLVDFGLARREEDQVTVTLDGQILGTPAYMSPEQAAGDQNRVGPRSDGYSLGVVLYELLTGERPFRGSKTMILYQVLQEEPRAPRSLNDHIPRDLETICLKAMAKDPGRRYASAGDLAADLRRFLQGEPIQARRTGSVERLWRWSRRNPLIATLTGAVASLLILVALVSAGLSIRTSRARDETSEQLSKHYVANGFRLVDQGDLLGSLPWVAEASQLDRGRPSQTESNRTRFESILLRCPKLVWVRFHPKIVLLVELNAAGDRLIYTTDGAAFLANLTSREDPIRLSHEGIIQFAGFSSEGNLAVTASRNGTARLWDASSGTFLVELSSHPGGIVHAAFSPGGRLVVTAGADRRAQLWETASGKPLGSPLSHQGRVNYAAFSPDGRLVATAGADGLARVWEVPTGKPAGPALDHGGRLHHVSFSPDGRRVITAGNDPSAIVWEVATGSRALPPLNHRYAVNRASFSSDGARILTVSSDTTAKVWDARTGELLLPPFRHILGVPHGEFSRDGRRVLTASYDSTVWLRDASTGDLVIPPLYLTHAPSRASLSANGRYLAIGLSDGVAQVWDLAGSGSERVVLEHGGNVLHAAFSPDGSRVVTASTSGTAIIWDAATGSRLPFAIRHRGAVGYAEFSPDSRRVVTASNDHTARVWDAATGEGLSPSLEHAHNVIHANFGPKGDRVATACGDGTARIWDAERGVELTPPLKHKAPVIRALFSPDGGRVLTASQDGTAVVWDAGTGEAVCPPMQYRLPGKPSALKCASFSPDGRRVAAGSLNETARVWDAFTGKPLTPLLVHTSTVNSILFSPDGRRVVTSSFDGSARVWDSFTGLPITPLLKHRSIVSHAAFGPDGHRVVSACEDGTALVWDADTGEQITPPLEHSGPVVFACFSPDGSKVLTASADGTARLWNLPGDDRPVEDAIRLAHMLSGRRIDATGGFRRLGLEEFRSDWESLSVEYPGLFATTPDEVLAWQNREAESLESLGLWAASVPFLDSLIAARPQQQSLLIRRGGARAASGSIEDAIRDFEEAMRLGPLDEGLVLALALLRLAHGDPEGYRKECERSFTEFGEAASAAAMNNRAWACCPGPEGLRDLTPAVELARKATVLEPRNRTYRNTLGAILYRAGDFQGAAGELRASLEMSAGEDEVWDWLFLAMAQHRLGHAQAARDTWEKIRAWARERAADFPGAASRRPPLSWRMLVEQGILLREAEAILGIPLGESG